jgi:hypothetical protein
MPPDVECPDVTPSTSSGGRRRKQFRTAVEGLRVRGSPSRVGRGDSDLLPLLDAPYADVDEAHVRLGELADALDERGDRRVVFLSVYVRMTGAVADRIRRGDFADPVWVSDYLVTFADLYREAVYAYETGDVDSLAAPWRLAFDAADRGDSLVVQDAALGVNAHINYDLALALERIGVGPDRAAKYEDHHLVTDVIRDILDETQDALVERDAPGLGVVDESLGSFDEWLWVFTIDECRDSAWRTAVALRSRSPLRRRFARWVNAVTSTGAARLVLASRTNARLHETLVRLEGSTDDAGRVE